MYGRTMGKRRTAKCCPPKYVNTPYNGVWMEAVRYCSGAILLEREISPGMKGG
jgi:hypothetical protein